MTRRAGDCWSESVGGPARAAGIGTLLVLLTLLPTAVAQNSPPTADAGKNLVVPVFVEIQIQGNGSDSDGNIAKYEWDFEGAGNWEDFTSMNGLGSHAYQEIKSFNTCLRVTDNDFAKTTDCITVRVESGNMKPVADAGADIYTWQDDVTTFVGGGSDPDGRLVKYEWDFNGDGIFDWKDTRTGTANWVYTVVGHYTAQLKVYDDGGVQADDTDETGVEVYPRNFPPRADAGEDFTTYADKQVMFHGTGSDEDGRLVKYEWDFDNDGKFEKSSDSTGQLSWTYKTAGTYVAVLQVTDSGQLPKTGRDRVTIQVRAPNNPPVAEAGEPIVVPWGTVVKFTGTGTDADTGGRVVLYEWDFTGDNNFDWSNGQNGETNYVFDRSGQFEAKLRVTDDAGASGTDTRTVTIQPKPVIKPRQTALVELNATFVLALALGLGAGIGAGFIYGGVRARRTWDAQMRSIRASEEQMEPGSRDDSDILVAGRGGSATGYARPLAGMGHADGEQPGVRGAAPAPAPPAQPAPPPAMPPPGYGAPPYGAPPGPPAGPGYGAPPPPQQGYPPQQPPPPPGYYGGQQR